MSKKFFLIFSLFLSFVFFAQPPRAGKVSVFAAPARNPNTTEHSLTTTAFVRGLAVTQDRHLGQRLISVSHNAQKGVLRPEPNVDFCDEKFAGQPLTLDPSLATLNDLVTQIYQRFGVSFIIGPEVGTLPLNIKAGVIPWATLLRSQLFVSGVRANCVAPNTIQLVKDTLTQSSDQVKTRVIRLKTIRPTTRENVDVAGQRATRGADIGGLTGCGADNSNALKIPQNCGRYEKLVGEIQNILGLISGASDGKPEQTPGRRSLTKIPGQGILIVRGTDEEIDLINEIVALADRPPYQIVVKGLVYTTNETLARDIGVQTSIVDRSTRPVSASILGQAVGTAGTLFDFSAIVGSVDFNVQASALEQNGLISIKSRPFATVLSGETMDLTVGRQVPVILQSVSTLFGLPASLEILQAGNLLSVTPNVIESENSVPTGVNLELQIESNSVDTSITNRDNVPVISVQSIQTRLLLNQDQTAILGGFTIDSDNRAVSKVPGLGDIPVIGELFKRRIRLKQLNRLYFAITVSILPYTQTPEPVKVPGVTTEPSSITPKMNKQARELEPKQVTTEPKPKGP